MVILVQSERNGNDCTDVYGLLLSYISKDEQGLDGRLWSQLLNVKVCNPNRRRQPCADLLAVLLLVFENE